MSKTLKVVAGLILASQKSTEIPPTAFSLSVLAATNGVPLLLKSWEKKAGQEAGVPNAHKR